MNATRFIIVYKVLDCFPMFIAIFVVVLFKKL